MNGWSLLKSVFSEPELENYEYITYSKFGRLYNVETISQKLREKFTFVKILVPKRKTSMSFIRPSELWGFVPEILFKADTLYAAISPSKATMFQKKRNPFTPKDLDLRKRILELYTWRFAGIVFTKEPKFEVQDVEKTPSRMKEG
jgi:hypothetical protein